MADIAALWAGRHRVGLHAPGSWTGSTDAISLTYLGSGCGFHGPSRMAKFCAAYPADRHALAQLDRFDNGLETTCLLTEGSRLVEECILSVFHHEAMDWLLPGLPPTNKQLSIPLVFVVEYAADGLLKTVRVHWDQASVLKQIGCPVLDVAVADAAARIRNPALVRPIAETVAGRVRVAAGLEGMKSLLSDLPETPSRTPTRHRKLPALESSIFRREESAPSTPMPRKKHASQESKLVFDDSVEPVKPVGLKLVDKIFAVQDDETPAPPAHPSIPVNPNRLQSRVFDDDNPFQPAYKVDTERLRSHVFDGEAEPYQPYTVKADARYLSSHIFDQSQGGAEQVKSNSLNASHFTLAESAEDSTHHQHTHRHDEDRNMDSHFEGGALCPTAEAPAIPGVKPINRNAGHLSGAGLEISASDDSPRISVATKPTQSFVFKSSISFCEEPQPKAKPAAPTSQVCFDESAAPVPPAPRLSEKNKSQIIF